MAPEPAGICPSCETRRGPVGEPCPEPVCWRKAYRYIPVGWHESAKAYATRKRRPMDPLLGRCIDRYLLAGKLGEGGMGAVYLALQRPLNREVALKVISGMELTQATVARFEREARAIALLDHGNIRKLHDYGVGSLEVPAGSPADFQVPYMALEYIRHGRTLRHALADARQEAGGPIPGEVVQAIFRQVLHALGTAHDKGIVHRDMKPDNVMLAPERGNPYLVKVLDFGLAKAVSDLSGFDAEVSRTGLFLGTPHYMAPEQAGSRDRHDVDARCDLYAVAVMLFEVFTGVRPYDGDTPLEVLTRKVDARFDPLGLPEARGLPRALRAFLSKGMAPAPEGRYPDAESMLEAFEKAMSGRAATAVGPMVRASASSEERPHTPPSPVDTVTPVAEPTWPLGTRRDAGATRVPTDAAMSTRDIRGLRGSRWPWIAAPLVALVVVGVGYLGFAGGAGNEAVMGVQADDAVADLGDSTVLEAAPASAPPVAVTPEVLSGGSVVPPPAGLQIRFESKPAGAKVYSGAGLLGETPFRAVLDGSAGVRVFRFQRKGYRDENVSADVVDGGVVEATLSPLSPKSRRLGPHPQPVPTPPENEGYPPL